LAFLSLCPLLFTSSETSEEYWSKILFSFVFFWLAVLTIGDSDECVINKKINTVKVTRRKLFIFKPKTYVFEIDNIDDISVETVKEETKYSIKIHYRIDIIMDNGINFPLTSVLYVKKEPLDEVAMEMKKFLGLKDEVDEDNQEITSDHDGNHPIIDEVHDKDK